MTENSQAPRRTLCVECGPDVEIALVSEGVRGEWTVAMTVAAARERARKELADKVRAALCKRCKAGLPVIRDASLAGLWRHPGSTDRICSCPGPVHYALGTPTGGPDERA